MTPSTISPKPTIRPMREGPSILGIERIEKEAIRIIIPKIIKIMVVEFSVKVTTGNIE